MYLLSSYKPVSGRVSSNMVVVEIDALSGTLIPRSSWSGRGGLRH